MFLTFRIFLVAGPLDARATGQLSIAHTAIIAASAFGHPLPFFGNFLRFCEWKTGISIFVYEIHALGIV